MTATDPICDIPCPALVSPRRPVGLAQRHSKDARRGGSAERGSRPSAVTTAGVSRECARRAARSAFVGQPPVARGEAGPLPVAFFRMPGRQGCPRSCADLRGGYRHGASSVARSPSPRVSWSSARCPGAGQQENEIAARWAERGFTRLVEALCMLFHWWLDRLPQNCCETLRLRSDELKTVFG